MYKLIELVYAAVEDPGRWEEFLAAFASAIHTTRAYFWVSRLNPSRPLFSASFGSTPEIKALLSCADYRDPWFARVDLAGVQLGAILRSDDICPDNVVVHDKHYKRLQQVTDDHYGGGVMLERTDGHSAGMSTIRPRAAGRLTDEELATWAALVPHLRAAVRVAAASDRITSERDAMMRYFDDLQHGVVLTTSSGWVCAVNSKAATILEHGAVLRTHLGHITAVDATARERLSEALFKTGTGMWTSDPVWIKLNRTTESPLLAAVIPIRSKAQAKISPEGPTAAIYLSGGATSTANLRPDPLRELFGFTIAEARVAIRLASGDSLREAAENLGVSLNTVRTHLQRAVAKAGVKRQAELVALVLSVAPAAIGNPSPPAE